MAFDSEKIIFRKSLPISDPSCNYNGFAPGKTILKEGTVCKPGHAPLKCDVLYDRDVAIKMRDGVTLYADIFRPADETVKVPAILNSTSFGKGKKEDANRNSGPGRLCGPEDEVPGVKKWMTSGLNSFESTDPGFFVPNGYAVVNLDIRGAYMSEGKNHYFGVKEAEDDYDVIEWLAVQPWCNGCVTMTGNSWLGIDQWFAGAECPPHLVCLAPWEGWHDMYRDEYMVGGIPNYPGFRFNNVYRDGGEMEDVIQMCLNHPLFDEYWDDKQAKPEKIRIPVYATASWTSAVHCQGTLLAWRKLGTDKKWLRIHHTQEWGDTYDPVNEADMLKFFDHYMKGIDNGWEETPKVRLSVLDNGGEDIVERIEEDFPLKRQQLKELHLDAADMTIKETAPESEASASYCGWDGKGMAKFRYTFTEESEIVGYINVKLFVESFGYNDLDLFVRAQVLDENGDVLWHYPVKDIPKFGPYSGPTSRQRVSLRAIDPEKSTVNEPYHPFNQVEKLLPGEIVPVEIGLFPTGLRFHKGQILELQIAGYPFFELPGGFGDTMKVGTDNNGTHIIHTGGQYDSKMIVPFIPV